MGGGGFSLTLQLQKVGSQPAASGDAVVEVVEGEEVGGDGARVSGARGSRLRRDVCDGTARVHTAGTRHLQHSHGGR